MLRKGCEHEPALANEVVFDRGGVPPRSKGFETFSERGTTSARGEALEPTPMEGVSGDRGHASAFTAAREDVIFGGSGN